jgi:hypothetical protein
MMGRQQRDQGRLFYEFRLEGRIPENHLLRRMNIHGADARLIPASCLRMSAIGAGCRRAALEGPRRHGFGHGSATLLWAAIASVRCLSRRANCSHPSA